MNKKKLRTLEEIKEEVKEPKYDITERFAKISDDKKSLLVRIPQEIRKKFNLKAGDRLRFHAQFEEEKKPELKIELIKC